MRLQNLSTFTASLLLANAALVASSITISQLPNACSSYPAYDNSTGIAGPFIAVADSTGGDIDGNKISAESFTSDGKDHYGFLTVPKTSSRFTDQYVQNITLRCINSTLQAQVNVNHSTAIGGIQWVDIFIPASENWQASFGYGQYLTPSIPVQPYTHYINGTMVNGVFLGAGNSTSWEFKYIFGGVIGEYYLLRLLGENGSRTATKGLERRQYPPLDDRNYFGYLKIVG